MLITLYRAICFLKGENRVDDLKISFFGPFALSFGGSVIKEDSKRSHKQWRLIKYLILNVGRDVPRRELVDATFGYGSYFGENEKALNALNAVIHRARKTLDGAKIPISITHRAGKYTIVLPENTEIDSSRFASLTDSIFSESDPRVIRERALEATSLYRGFFLNGNYFDEKTRLLAEKYHSDYRRIFALLCTLLRSDGSFSLVAEISRRAIEVDPLCEAFYVEYINALAALGDSVHAKRVYLDALAFFESKTSVIISGALREFGQSIDTASETVVLLPKEHSDKADAVSAAISRELGGAKVRVSLI